MLFVVFAFCSLFCGLTVCECLTVFVAVVFGVCLLCTFSGLVFGWCPFRICGFRLVGVLCFGGLICLGL